MGAEDSFKLCNSSTVGHVRVIDHPCEPSSEAIKSDSPPLNSQLIDETHETAVSGLHRSMETSRIEFEKQLVSDSTLPSLVGVEITESISSKHTENGSLAVQRETGFDSHEEEGTLMNKRQMDASSFSGVKRPRINVDEHQPSVHIVYNFLPRESQQKLEELLQLWSQWHSQSCSSSKTQGSNVTLESGEKTYFPALRLCSDKPSDVTFWMDNQTKILSSEEFTQLDANNVPLYDRGYSLALTSVDGSSKLNGRVEKLDSSRCFNCGSYSHALKDCPKPRDNVAVNNARKEHKSKRIQHANSRNSTRYYQSSRGGKYDGLAPGMLHADTRRALGLGELDPPPWLVRMREIGYPPGYLDADVDEQPSGITIFGVEEDEKETANGDILDSNTTKPSRKMTVEFPGINAPLPENADGKLWAPTSSSRLHHSRESSHRREYNHSSENPGRWHSTERRFRELEDEGPPGCDPRASLGRGHSTEKRWFRDLEDDGPPGCDPRASLGRWPSTERRWLRDLEDDGPPGCDSRVSFSLANHSRRYRDHGDFGDYSPSASPAIPRSSSYNRSFSDNYRSPLHDGFSSPALDNLPTYGDYNNEYSFSPRARRMIPLSSSHGRSYSDRGRISPLVHDGSPNDGWHRTFPYSSPR